MTGDPLKLQQHALGLETDQLQQASDTADDNVEQLDGDQSSQDSDASTTSQLPALDDSDTLVRESLAGLSETATWARWLGTSQPIRKFVQLVENISRGKVPHQHFRFMAPSGQFEVDHEPNNHYLLSPTGYKRYNRIAKSIDSLDAESVVSAYAMLKPLMQSAWSEMKPDQTTESDETFDTLVLAAIKKVQAAPTIRSNVNLIRPSVMYKFADPKLERLNAVSKQMMRMGPTNTRIIQKKLADIEVLIRARQNPVPLPMQVPESTSTSQHKEQAE
jgi:hypothetical protein